MPLNPAKVGLAVQGGLSVVCATCTLYWRARDAGVPEPQCLATDGCGSPLRGDDFHEYQGPISDLSRWCFVCGAASVFGLRALGKTRTIGACQEHVRMVDTVRPLLDLPGELKSHVVGPDVPKINGVGRRSLLQTLLTAESSRQGR